MNESVRQNLSAEQWAAAALDAIAAAGVEAVSVEALARKLGVTKGSFYWHFSNREALVTAALELWERRETTDTIKDAENEPDPYQRIVSLFKRANTSHLAGRLYLALAAASDHPSVTAVVRRVSQRRLEYLENCYRALGLQPADARRWSTFAYATFIGNQQVHRDAPERFPAGAEFREYFKLMLTTLIPKPLAAPASAHHLQPERHPHVVEIRPPPLR